MSGPVMRRSARSKASIEAMTGASLSEEMRGVDGCSIPTYAIPLVALARGFARLGTGRELRRNAATPRRASAPPSLRTP